MQPESSREAAVRVPIADDHPVFRYGMAALLAADPRIDLVGEAGTGIGLSSSTNAFTRM